MYNPFIIGKQIYLRHPMEEDALGRWHEWFSDEETTKYMSDRYWPNSKESQLGFYKSLLTDKTRLALSVVIKSNDEHVGVISLSGINMVHRYADIALVIGEKKHNNGPIATETFALMLKVAFVRLNMLNVKSAYSRVNKNSEALHRLFKFKKVGVYEELLRINGHAEDMVVEVLNNKRWFQRNPQ
jgi:[ribosomal protein S5]-alanine N-acetyltransferase